MILSIILPSYNEKGNIVRLIDKILSICKVSRIKNFEIIVVDDNSPDKTADYCKKVFRKKGNIKVYTRTTERGLASAIKFGINQSRGKYLVVMDTDFNHNPQEIPKMLTLTNKYDIIIGSRFVKKGGMENKKRYYLSKIYNYFIKHISQTDFTDSLSGFFCVKSRQLKKLNSDYIFRGYGEYFIRLLILVKLEGFKHTEIPVYYKNRDYGESKSKFLSMFLIYTSTIFEVLRWNKNK